MARMVASSCASPRNSGETRHSSRARVRGGNRDASFLRSMSHSGCGSEPTSDVGSRTGFILRSNFYLITGAMQKYIFTDGLRQNVVYLKFWRELSWQAM